jgi:dUTP pyrophosphatase
MKRLLWKKIPESTCGEVRNPALPGDAGFDLLVAEPIEIVPGKISTIECGVKIALPDGIVAVPIPRSSAVARGLFIFITLIDTGYHGPIFLFATSMSGKSIFLTAGMRVGQLFPLANVSLDIVVEQVDVLPPSERGENGFGSSGGAVEGPFDASIIPGTHGRKRI